MKFQSKMVGDLKFTTKTRGGDGLDRTITMAFPVKVAQSIELLPGTVAMYKDSIRKHVKERRLVALDEEAKAFLAAK